MELRFDVPPVLSASHKEKRIYLIITEPLNHIYRAATNHLFCFWS